MPISTVEAKSSVLVWHKKGMDSRISEIISQVRNSVQGVGRVKKLKASGMLIVECVENGENEESQTCEEETIEQFLTFSEVTKAAHDGIVHFDSDHQSAGVPEASNSTEVTGRRALSEATNQFHSVPTVNSAIASAVSKRWGLYNPEDPDNDIDIVDAWKLFTKDREESMGSNAPNPVIVAVVDSGIDYNHPDLQRHMWVNPNEIPGNGIDDDNNGYVDDVHGINLCHENGDPMDDHGHGTEIAGAIMSVQPPDEMFQNSAQSNVKLMALKVACLPGRKENYEDPSFNNIDWQYWTSKEQVEHNYETVLGTWGETRGDVCAGCMRTTKNVKQKPTVSTFAHIYEAWNYMIENGAFISNNAFEGKVVQEKNNRYGESHGTYDLKDKYGIGSMAELIKDLTENTVDKKKHLFIAAAGNGIDAVARNYEEAYKFQLYSGKLRGMIKDLDDFDNHLLCGNLGAIGMDTTEKLNLLCVSATAQQGANSHLFKDTDSPSFPPPPSVPPKTPCTAHNCFHGNPVTRMMSLAELSEYKNFDPEKNSESLNSESDSSDSESLISQNQCWVAIHNYVIDVTKWRRARGHPGGPYVFKCGEDITEDFQNLHGDLDALKRRIEAKENAKYLGADAVPGGVVKARLVEAAEQKHRKFMEENYGLDWYQMKHMEDAFVPIVDPEWETTASDENNHKYKNSGYNTDGSKYLFREYLFENENGQMLPKRHLNGTNIYRDFEAPAGYVPSYEGSLYYLSNYGENKVALAAPGARIYSSSTSEGFGVYRMNSGTSFAAAYVTGVAALLKSFRPQLDGEQIREIIEIGGTTSKDWLQNRVRTGGMLNAKKALQYAEERHGLQQNFAPPQTKLKNMRVNLDEVEQKGLALEIEFDTNPANGQSDVDSIELWYLDGEKRKVTQFPNSRIVPPMTLSAQDSWGSGCYYYVMECPGPEKNGQWDSKYSKQWLADSGKWPTDLHTNKESCEEKRAGSWDSFCGKGNVRMHFYQKSGAGQNLNFADLYLHGFQNGIPIPKSAVSLAAFPVKGSEFSKALFTRATADAEISIADLESSKRMDHGSKDYTAHSLKVTNDFHTARNKFTGVVSFKPSPIEHAITEYKIYQGKKPGSDSNAGFENNNSLSTQQALATIPARYDYHKPACQNRDSETCSKITIEELNVGLPGVEDLVEGEQSPSSSAGPHKLTTNKQFRIRRFQPDPDYRKPTAEDTNPFAVNNCDNSVAESLSCMDRYFMVPKHFQKPESRFGGIPYEPLEEASISVKGPCRIHIEKIDIKSPGPDSAGDYLQIGDRVIRSEYKRADDKSYSASEDRLPKFDDIYLGPGDHTIHWHTGNKVWHRPVKIYRSLYRWSEGWEAPVDTKDVKQGYVYQNKDAPGSYSFAGREGFSLIYEQIGFYKVPVDILSNYNPGTGGILYVVPSYKGQEPMSGNQNLRQDPSYPKENGNYVMMPSDKTASSGGKSPDTKPEQIEFRDRNMEAGKISGRVKVAASSQSSSDRTRSISVFLERFENESDSLFAVADAQARFMASFDDISSAQKEYSCDLNNQKACEISLPETQLWPEHDVWYAKYGSWKIAHPTFRSRNVHGPNLAGEDYEFWKPGMYSSSNTERDAGNCFAPEVRPQDRNAKISCERDDAKYWNACDNRCDTKTPAQRVAIDAQKCSDNKTLDETTRIASCRAVCEDTSQENTEHNKKLKLNACSAVCEKSSSSSAGATTACQLSEDLCISEGPRLGKKWLPDQKKCVDKTGQDFCFDFPMPLLNIPTTNEKAAREREAALDCRGACIREIYSDEDSSPSSPTSGNQKTRKTFLELVQGIQNQNLNSEQNYYSPACERAISAGLISPPPAPPGPKTHHYRLVAREKNGFGISRTQSLALRVTDLGLNKQEQKYLQNAKFAIDVDADENQIGGDISLAPGKNLEGVSGFNAYYQDEAANLSQDSGAALSSSTLTPVGSVSLPIMCPPTVQENADAQYPNPEYPDLEENSFASVNCESPFAPKVVGLSKNGIKVEYLLNSMEDADNTNSESKDQISYRISRFQYDPNEQAEIYFPYSGTIEIEWMDIGDRGEDKLLSMWDTLENEYPRDLTLLSDGFDFSNYKTYPWKRDKIFVKGGTSRSYLKWESDFDDSKWEGITWKFRYSGYISPPEDPKNLLYIERDGESWYDMDKVDGIVKRHYPGPSGDPSEDGKYFLGAGWVLKYTPIIPKLVVKPDTSVDLANADLQQGQSIGLQQHRQLVVAPVFKASSVATGSTTANRNSVNMVSFGPSEFVKDLVDEVWTNNIRCRETNMMCYIPDQLSKELKWRVKSTETLPEECKPIVSGQGVTYFDIKRGTCGMEREYDSERGMVTDKVVIESYVSEDGNSQQQQRRLSNTDNSALLFSGSSTDSQNSSNGHQIHCQCETAMTATTALQNGIDVGEVPTEDPGAVQDAYTRTTREDIKASLTLYTDETFKQKISRSKNEIPAASERFYLEVATSSPLDQISIENCSAGWNELAVTEGDAIPKNQNHNFGPGYTKLVKDFCLDDQDITLIKHGGAVKEYDVLDNNPNTNTNKHRISIPKFKFQGAKTVFLKCSIRICDTKPCGRCDKSSSGGRRLSVSASYSSNNSGSLSFSFDEYDKNVITLAGSQIIRPVYVTDTKIVDPYHHVTGSLLGKESTTIFEVDQDTIAGIEADPTLHDSLSSTVYMLGPDAHWAKKNMEVVRKALKTTLNLQSHEKLVITRMSEVGSSNSQGAAAGSFGSKSASGRRLSRKTQANNLAEVCENPKTNFDKSRRLSESTVSTKTAAAASSSSTQLPQQEKSRIQIEFRVYPGDFESLRKINKTLTKMHLPKSPYLTIFLTSLDEELTKVGRATMGLDAGKNIVFGLPDATGRVSTTRGG